MIQHSQPIYGIKAKNNRYIEANDEFCQLVKFPNKKSMIGLTDSEICSHAYVSEHCDSDLIERDFALEHESVMRGESIFIFDTLIVHNSLVYFLVHKYPYITHKYIDGTVITAITLQDLSPVQIKNYLSNPNIRISEHTKKFLDIYKLVPSRQYDFTKRQWQCLNLLVKGYSAKDISIEVNRSKRTIDCHINNIKEKLGVSKMSELVAKAISESIVS